MSDRKFFPGVGPLAVTQLRRPGVHEKKFAALFSGRTRFDGAAPVFDQPLLLLGFTNRCGSHLLADYLCQSGGIGGLGEFCNHDVVANMSAKHEIGSFPDHIAALVARVCSRGQMFGTKASWDQIAMLLRWNIPAMFSGVRIIHLTRADMVAQAVSHSIARQTGIWTSLQENPDGDQAGNQDRSPRFLADDIGATISVNTMANEFIRQIAEASGIAHMSLTYEKLLRYPDLHLGRLLQFCGLDLPQWGARRHGFKNRQIRRIPPLSRPITR